MRLPEPYGFFVVEDIFQMHHTDRCMISEEVTPLCYEPLDFATLLGLSSITFHHHVARHRVSLQQVNVSLSDGVFVSHIGKLLISFL